MDMYKKEIMADISGVWIVQWGNHVPNKEGLRVFGTWDDANECLQNLYSHIYKDMWGEFEHVPSKLNEHIKVIENMKVGDEARYDLSRDYKLDMRFYKIEKTGIFTKSAKKQ